MISEIDNILKGSVVKSQEYDTLRKLIGVANQNLVPNANGDISLAKQRAFIVETKNKEIMETLDNALNQAQNTEEKVESLDLENPLGQIQMPEVSMPETNTNKFTSELNNIPVPTENNMVLENPIKVEDPNSLSQLTNPLENIQIPQSVPETQEKQPIMDLQMPEIPTDIVASEPTNSDTNLFETNIPPMPQTNPTEKMELEMPQINSTESMDLQMPQIAEMEQNVEQEKPLDIQMPSFEAAFDLPTNIEPPKEEPKPVVENNSIQEQQNVILNRIDELNAEINKCFAELKELMKKNNTKEQQINTVPEHNSLVNDALNQINNMVIPSMENPMKL